MKLLSNSAPLVSIGPDADLEICVSQSFSPVFMFLLSSDVDVQRCRARVLPSVEESHLG